MATTLTWLGEGLADTGPTTHPKEKYDVQLLFDQNAQWNNNTKREQPDLVHSLATTQTPKIMWIGCSDSRVAPELLTGSSIGDIFVYRNVANVVTEGDISFFAFLEYSLTALAIEHVVVTGHVGCGGVAAALKDKSPGRYLAPYLDAIKGIRDNNQAYFDGLGSDDEVNRRLVELNIIRSARAVERSQVYRSAKQTNPQIQIHTWLYNITDLVLSVVDRDLPEHTQVTF
ncbi:hypothetical protein IWQ62_000975 [Dispira parvispora]|uniref:Carbonic anhydrase n=1 Tax=Dispira parvispora TaxID=1520584 RepID=A0A9W8B047_9FUNG|nr:hypothetical protein IWQ62_000975 [Dispira parvispora]